MKNFMVHFCGAGLPDDYWNNVDSGATREEVRIYRDPNLVDEIKRDVVLFDKNQRIIESYLKVDLEPGGDNRFFVARGVGGRPMDNLWAESGYSYVCPFRESVDNRIPDGPIPSISGAEVYAGGVAGRGLEFDGNTTLLFDDQDMFGASGFSISMTIKPNLQADHPDEYVIFTNATSDGGSWCKVVILDERRFAVRVGVGGVTYEESSFGVEDGQWYHVVLMYNGFDRFLLFINGEQRTAVQIQAQDSYTAGRKTVIGGGLPQDFHFAGVMDEVRLSARQLSNDWVYAEFKNKISPSEFIG